MSSRLRKAKFSSDSRGLLFTGLGYLVFQLGSTQRY